MNKKKAVVCFLITLGLVLFLSPFASRLPDPLEKIAQEKIFLDKERTLAGIKNERLPAAVAGICGITAVFLLGCSIAALLRKKKKI